MCVCICSRPLFFYLFFTFFFTFYLCLYLLPFTSACEGNGCAMKGMQGMSATTLAHAPSMQIACTCIATAVNERDARVAASPAQACLLSIPSSHQGHVCVCTGFLCLASAACSHGSTWCINLV